MSQFKGFESFLVPLGASIADAHHTIKAALVTYGWQVVTDNTGSTPTVLEVIPPATETIGGNGSYEILRLNFSASSISMVPIKKWVNGLPQQVYITALTAGAVVCSCTLGGQTVSYTGIGGNTAVQNLMGLYAAIRDSANATFTAWDWEVSYPAAQNSNDTNTYIYGINRTVEANKTFTGSNVTAGIQADYFAPGGTTPAAVLVTAQTITTDLVNGFIYYLQVSARGIALAVKTTVGFNGPIHACYAKNSAAIAYMPTDQQFVTPIELVVGYDGAASTSQSTGYTANRWMLPAANTPLWDPAGSYTPAAVNFGNRRHRFTDAVAAGGYQGSAASYGPSWGPFTLIGSGLFQAASAGGSSNDFQIQRMKTTGITTWNDGNTSGPLNQLTGVVPGYEIEDWYKFVGTGTQEGLILVADTVAVAGLASNYAPGDTVLNLVSGANFQSSGFAIIGNEALQYTGKTGNQLTGVTGGKYGTPSTRHFTSDLVGQGLWFVIINGGALLAGYNKPT